MKPVICLLSEKTGKLTFRGEKWDLNLNLPLRFELQNRYTSAVCRPVSSERSETIASSLAAPHLPHSLHLCSTAGDVLYSSTKSNILSLRSVKVTSLSRTRLPRIVHSSCN